MDVEFRSEIRHEQFRLHRDDKTWAMRQVGRFLSYCIQEIGEAGRPYPESSRLRRRHVSDDSQVYVACTAWPYAESPALPGSEGRVPQQLSALLSEDEE